MDFKYKEEVYRGSDKVSLKKKKEKSYNMTNKDSTFPNLAMLLFWTFYLPGSFLYQSWSPLLYFTSFFSSSWKLLACFSSEQSSVFQITT